MNNYTLYRDTIYDLFIGGVEARINNNVEIVKNILRNSGDDCEDYLQILVLGMTRYLLMDKPITNWLRDLFDFILNLPCSQSLVNIINEYSNGSIRGFSDEQKRRWFEFINELLQEYKYRAESNRELPDILYSIGESYHPSFNVTGVNEIIRSYVNLPDVNVDIDEIYTPRRGTVRRNPSRRSRSRSRSPNRRSSRRSKSPNRHRGGMKGSP